MEKQENQDVMLVTNKLLGFSEGMLPVIDPNHPVNYSKQSVPPNYQCGKCGVTGCKLWREYQAFLNNQSLLCLTCACLEQKTMRKPTEDGCSLYTGKVHYWYRTATSQPDCWNGYDPKDGPPQEAIETKTERERSDQIGWRIPAIPTKENDTYWGYTSVPQEGCDWWYRLPTLSS